MSLATLIKHLEDSKIKENILSSDIFLSELTLIVKTPSIEEVLKFLRDDPECLFRILVDITAVDYPEREERFEVVYQLLSIEHNLRIRIKINANINTKVQSLSKLFSAAGWYEREIWDLMGITFKEHTDLRRILTDYGFEGHPLRKDFPLTGYVEVRYDLEAKQVVYEPVKLSQDFRNFDFVSPWEGPDYALPGDEKATKE